MARRPGTGVSWAVLDFDAVVFGAPAGVKPRAIIDREAARMIESNNMVSITALALMVDFFRNEWCSTLWPRLPPNSLVFSRHANKFGDLLARIPNQNDVLPYFPVYSRW